MQHVASCTAVFRARKGGGFKVPRFFVVVVDFHAAVNGKHERARKEASCVVRVSAEASRFRTFFWC